MDYYFKYRNEPVDLWKLSMHSLYRSMAGFANIVFTVSVVMLSIKFFSSVHWGLKLLLVLAMCLFTLIQPLAIYLRAKRQLAGTPGGTAIGFDARGLHVEAGGRKSDLDWTAVLGIARHPGCLAIHTGSGQGFVLPDRVLEEQKEAVYQYVADHLR